MHSTNMSGINCKISRVLKRFNAKTYIKTMVLVLFGSYLWSKSIITLLANIPTVSRVCITKKITTICRLGRG